MKIVFVGLLLFNSRCSCSAQSENKNCSISSLQIIVSTGVNNCFVTFAFVKKCFGNQSVPYARKHPLLDPAQKKILFGFYKNDANDQKVSSKIAPCAIYY